MKTQTFITASLLVATIFVQGTARSVHAQQGAAPEVADGMQRLASAISEFFERERHDKVVSVGSVVNPDGEGSELLKRLLVEHLTKADFQLRKGKFSVDGRFVKEFRKKDTLDGRNFVALRVTAEIRDRTSDQIVQPIAIPIFGDGAIQVLGPSADLPPAASETERQQKVNDAIDTPAAAIVANESRASDDSPFGVEIRVRRGTGSDSTPRKPTDQEGQSFVKLSRGEEYVVRLHNRAKFEVAVTLTIDGLSMFAFSKENNFDSQILVPPGTVVDVPGWYITSDNTDAFEITSYSKSAAASQGLSGGIGVMTAAFSASWDPSSRPPADELRPKSIGDATGRGRQIDQKYQSVPRVIGKLRSLISVRYSR